jgi:hypothetical protein
MATNPRANIGQKNLLLIGCLALLLFGVKSAVAQTTNSLTLTITPPLIKVNMSPGDMWQSAVKLINNNIEPVTVYVDKLDFKSSEDGGIKFLQGEEAGSTGGKFLLSQWLEFAPGPFTIEAQKELEIPFTINLPVEAEPGGHYAAILAGSKPVGNLSGSGIKISSLLASLIMLEVKGEVIEHGQIREFSTDKKVYTQPSADFTIRFANTGNIHLQPQGEIKIYNMFGQDQGTITINHSTEYGNVLPDSIRKWNFNWEAPKSLSAMGRYKAILILGYGNQVRETANQTVYFWLIYPWPLILIVGGVIFLALIIVFSLRFYIRRAIVKSSSDAGLIVPRATGKTKISIIPSENNGQNYQTVITKTKAKTKIELPEQSFFKKHWLLITVITIILIVLVYWYYGQGIINRKNILPTTKQEISQPINTAGQNDITGTSSQVVGGEGQADVIASNTPVADLATSTAISSEEQAEKKAVEENTAATTTEQKAVITILNGSGRAGLAATAEKAVNQIGFQVANVGNADNFDYQNTIIKYKVGFGQIAEQISKIFTDKYEMESVTDQTVDILIIIGKNY